MTSDTQILATAPAGIRNLASEVEDCIARWRKVDVTELCKTRPDAVLKLYHALNSLRATCLAVEITPEATETCVLCATDTGIPANTPIARRENYVEGCGQLCPACAAKVR